MERYLGAFEHLYWLYNQFYPIDFVTVAKLQGQFSSAPMPPPLLKQRNRNISVN
ncbi:hypothetical protein NIES4071_07200 [Calothrix sp. NIES-4071]|nr:hypothetical protein NIES4071_07200 [Calothrix sp. NIES-4071]BAZ55062.1 hypothetical protein NIES4105_07160 [Calothrix sp. NIES-4105]